MISNLTVSQLRQAADIKDQIEVLRGQLAAIENGGGGTVPTAGKRRKISAAGLARMRAGQKARWAKVKGDKPAKTEKKTRKKMSAASRAKIAAGAKARWAKVRAEKATIV